MKVLGLISLCGLMVGCMSDRASIEIYETSAGGHQMTSVIPSAQRAAEAVLVTMDPTVTNQKITGFGGSFTESTASLLLQMSDGRRKEILEAYFGAEGSRYSLTRTHINSCDFSLSQYAYAMVPGDTMLQHFDISHDEQYLIPVIREAQSISPQGFKIIASPWTAPPWMKDNQDWVGGKLMPQYYSTWALYFARYIEEYAKKGIDIWGLTVENEPLGNGNNWESMHFSAEEMDRFVKEHLSPILDKLGHDEIKVLGYDQNRDELRQWVDVMYPESSTSDHWDGTAIHWYASTYMVFEEELEYAKGKAPDKHLIQTEACIDSEVPAWEDDQWYWSPVATDWGYDWASAEEKHRHPKYVPAYRYARDIIGCLNHGVDGWVDWNMVLDKNGGPNWFENWCGAPVLVDTETDEVYFTPLYYVLQHFSRYIQPGALQCPVRVSDQSILATGAINPDGTRVIVLFNPTETQRAVYLQLDGDAWNIELQGQALQTIVIRPSMIPNTERQ